MEESLFISRDLFNRLINLATYLEEHALYFLNMIHETSFKGLKDDPKIESYSQLLSAILHRSQKIREELLSSAKNQAVIFNCDEAYFDVLKDLGADFAYLTKVCEEIADPNYYVDAEGFLRKVDK